MIEIALAPFIAGDGQLSQLGVKSVTPLRATQDVIRPLILFHRVSSNTEYTLTGVDGLSHHRIAVESEAYDYPTAKKINQRVVQLLNGFSGSMGQYTVYGIHFDDGRDEYVAPVNANDQAIYRICSEFVIWYGEF